jgi:hypothetical protein
MKKTTPVAPAPAPAPRRDEKDGPIIACGDIDIRIDRNGMWFYQGSPITRKELVCLFASTLIRDPAGDFWLATPTERLRIRVDDAPFAAVELYTSGAGREQIISIRTNIDEVITIDDQHPLEVVTDNRTGEPSPYVTLRPGIAARLTRPVYYEVVALGVEEKVNGEVFYGVWSSGSFFVMGRLEGVP